ncbi:MRP-L47-domain-containing protein [Obba rivulosa]|uniref:Large ribosomal subunit protein uL29m n=1 Tax=Obba rivulosa TaxID=1052685 RepID=A0A8E2AR18_9APHY|nr:MRP-L47-domain-containing protein [Obba rivulosa]
MLPSMSTRAFSSLLSLSLRARTLATHATNLPSTSSEAQKETAVATSKAPEGAAEGALRPHLNIPVNPNHGLYAFFRKTVKDGVTSYETLESPNSLSYRSGRSWTAAELRRKSFKDLHTLWYVLLRERNLLATQAEEGRRVLGGKIAGTPLSKQAFKCRKSMARIKYVIQERRLAYEGAVRLFAEQREKQLAAQARRAGAIKEPAGDAAEEAEKGRTQPDEAQSAANLAVSGLFESVRQDTGRRA